MTLFISPTKIQTKCSVDVLVRVKVFGPHLIWTATCNVNWTSPQLFLLFGFSADKQRSLTAVILRWLKCLGFIGCSCDTRQLSSSILFIWHMKLSVVDMFMSVIVKTYFKWNAVVWAIWLLGIKVNENCFLCDKIWIKKQPLKYHSTYNLWIFF